MPTVENESTLADKFADYFMEKIQKICDSLKNYENFKPSVKKVNSFETFDNLSENEIRKFINQLQTKSCELDILPTKILKTYRNELLPTITCLVNLLLSRSFSFQMETSNSKTFA